MLEETGVVVEERGDRALVRVRRGPQCAGCGAAGICHGGAPAGEGLVEAENTAGARVGDAVTLSAPGGAVLRASFKVYLVPVIGLLLGAAITQAVAGRFLSPGAAQKAAAVGGLIGAVAAVLAVRSLDRRRGRPPEPPRITRVRDGAPPEGRR